MIERDLLNKVDGQLRERYSKRLKEHGPGPKTLGWDSKKSQWARFSVAFDSMAFSGKKILDIGCGLADFNEFLQEKAQPPVISYSGFDINPDLINVCQERFPDAQFEVRNILVDPPLAAEWEVVTLFGILNFRFGEFDNITFARNMIQQAFSLCREAVVVDMLSARNDDSYPKEDFVYYYDPAEMLDFALSLTPHVTLRHDYPSIPQREFMLILRREPCKL